MKISGHIIECDVKIFNRIDVHFMILTDIGPNVDCEIFGECGETF